MGRRHRRKRENKINSKSSGGLRFLGVTTSPETQITLGAFGGHVDPRVIKASQAAIEILGGCIANARSYSEGRKSEPKLEILLGLALLAFSEAQALLMLCSGGLERSARVHMRSLFEYTIRASIILEDSVKAEQFMAAALAELDYLGKSIAADQQTIDEAKAQYLGSLPSTTATMREKRALGGDMSTLIKARSGDKVYGTMYAYPSLFSHGSILALDEVSRALKGVGNNFQDSVNKDGRGAIYLLSGAHFCCDLAANLVREFHSDAVQKLETTVASIIALQTELGAAIP
jgi:hypothetical protein